MKVIRFKINWLKFYISWSGLDFYKIVYLEMLILKFWFVWSLEMSLNKKNKN